MSTQQLTQNGLGKPFPVAYGTVRCGGQLVFYRTDSTQRYLYLDYVISEGEVSAVYDVRFGDYTPQQAGMTLGSTYNVYLGTPSQAVDPLCSGIDPLYVSGKPGTAHVTFKIDGNHPIGSKVDPYSLLVTCDGVKVRDPRTDSTLVNRYSRRNPALANIDLFTDTRYGAGFPDSAFDWATGDATHSWSDGADVCDVAIGSQGGAPSSAPGLSDPGSGATGQLRAGTSYSYVYTNYTNGVESLASPSGSFTCVNRAINVGIVTGPTGTTQRRIYRTKGLTPSDTTKYLVAVVNDNTATNWQDALGDWQLQSTKAPGSVSPVRYAIGLWMGEQRAFSDWLAIFRALYMANYNYDGKYHVWIDAVRSDSGIVFDQTNIIGDVEIQTVGLSNMFSKVTGTFVNSELGFKQDTVAVEVPSLSQPASEVEREERRTGQYDFTGSPYYDQTTRLSRQILKRSRMTRRIMFDALLRGMRIMPGMVVLVSHDTGPLVNVKVIVTGVRLSDDGSAVSLAGEFYDAGIYSDTIEVNPAPLIVPGPSGGGEIPEVTGLTVTEVTVAGPNGVNTTKLKIAWTNPIYAFFSGVHITVNDGTNTVVLADAVTGPVYFENPRKGVQHTITVQVVAATDQLSTGVQATITPSGVAPPVPAAQNTVTISNGTNNDVAIDPLTYGVFLLSGLSGDATISGFTAGANAVGRSIVFLNDNAYTVTLKRMTGSSASNQIDTFTGGDIPIASKGSFALTYKSGSNWVLNFVHDSQGAFTQRGLNTALFTSGGTWTCPPGVTTAYLTGCGGGGGGGGYRTSPNDGCGGGGGGGDAILRRNVTVSPGTAYTVTIGGTASGGNSGTSPTDGTTGNTTSFGALLSLAGGNGGKHGGSGGFGNNGPGGERGGPGGSNGGRSGDTATFVIGGEGGGNIVSLGQGFAGVAVTSPYGAGGPGGAPAISVGASIGGPGFLYVEW